MQFFIFRVEPSVRHPRFYELEAGLAHVFLRDDCPEGESVARAYLLRHHLEPKELEAACVIPPSHHGRLPKEAREALSLHPIYAEICLYETGGGKELPEGLFSPDEEGRK
jgi:hypothetical protein